MICQSSREYLVRKFVTSRDILPNFVFLCFKIFAVKLECKIGKNAFTINWPSLIGKRDKLCFNKEKVCCDWLHVCHFFAADDLDPILPNFFRYLRLS